MLTTTFDGFKVSSNMVCSTHLQLFLLLKQELGRMPDTVFIHADNTPKESKSTIAIFFLIWIFIQLEGGSLTDFHLVFLMVGHTHDLVDAYFAQVSMALKHKDCLSVRG